MREMSYEMKLTQGDEPMTITEKPANGFNTRVLVCLLGATFTIPAWARFTDGSDDVEFIQIRKDGDFGGVYRTVHKSRVIIPA